MRTPPSFFKTQQFALLAIVMSVLAGLLVGPKSAIVVYLCANMVSLNAQGVFSAKMGDYTNIGNLWTPQIWIPGLRELVIQRPSLINSGAVVRSPLFEEVATGGGTSGNIPFLREPNPDDQIQVEGTAPTIQAISSGIQKCPIMNRVSPIGATALSRAITATSSGSVDAALTDPVTLALSVIADLRLRQRQKCLLAILRGAFGTGAAGTDTSALNIGGAGLRETHFSETLNTTASNFVDVYMMLDAVARLGEVKDKMKN